MYHRKPVTLFPALAFLFSCGTAVALAQSHLARNALGPAAELSVILGRPTDRSMTVSVLATRAIDLRIEYGTTSGSYSARTEMQTAAAGGPLVTTLDGLKPNTRYFYRLLTRAAGAGDLRPEPESAFQTQRSPGSTFTFGVQGDSHPEREGRMFDSQLYAQTMRNVAAQPPDFYFALGDDFSIENLIASKSMTPTAVDRVYAYQRGYLGVIGRSSALFLVNGNHEQAARANLDGTEMNPAVQAARARIRFFPLPTPDSFYTGDAEEIPGVGAARDYYAWTWGDALFVVLDFYWHSAVTVDNRAGARAHGDGNGKGRARPRDLWSVTLGDTQYRWLTKTLTESRARWKFVFCHHVLGTGRGGVECAPFYEWGGQDRRGSADFAAHRPGWPLPIHELFVKTGVTIFFQGHDHLYAHQSLDGVVYQECPNPADRTYEAFNRDAYRSGEILPNSGHIQVTVAPDSVRVDYVRSYLPSDEHGGAKNDAVAASYTIAAKPAGGAR